MEQRTATLRRALDALNAICVTPSAAQHKSRNPVAPIPQSDCVRFVPQDDLQAWREPFARWFNSACARHPRVFGGVIALHLAYCEWEIGHDGVPCSRETFERLLQELGFLIGEVEGTPLVSGLALREDVSATGL